MDHEDDCVSSPELSEEDYESSSDSSSSSSTTNGRIGKRKAIKDDFDMKVFKKNKHCRASKAKWTSEEDEILTKAVMINGEGNWKKIAQSLNDRSHLQCLHRWQKVLNPALVKGPWKEEEDLKLVELVEKYGPKDWSTIASHIKGRIGKQCRERWFNHLSPDVRKTNWTPEEDQIIIDAHQRLGNKWTAISKLLNGRPANAIKNHWNSTLLKRIQEKNGDQVEPRSRNRSKKKDQPPSLRESRSSSSSSSETESPDTLSPVMTPQPMVNQLKRSSSSVPLVQQVQPHLQSHPFQASQSHPMMIQHAPSNGNNRYHTFVANGGYMSNHGLMQVEHRSDGGMSMGSMGTLAPAGMGMGMFFTGSPEDVMFSSLEYSTPLGLAMPLSSSAFSHEFGLGLADSSLPLSSSPDFMELHHTAVASSAHPLPELQFCFESGIGSPCPPGMLSNGQDHSCSSGLGMGMGMEFTNSMLGLDFSNYCPLTLDPL